MSERKQAEDALALGAPIPVVPASADSVDAVPSAKVSPPPGSALQSASGPALSAEEQMERFAQDLKENDWGHQPC
jgi:hypothetical protein